MIPDNSEAVVEDGEGFKAETLNIGVIALRQYERCIIEGSKEMTRGGKSIKMVRGVAVPVDIVNQRNIFTNTVISMEIILRPIISRKDDIDKRLKEAKAKQDKIYEIFIQKRGKLRKDHNFSLERKRNIKNSLVVDYDKEMSYILDEYEVDLVAIYRLILTILSDLLDQENYFSEGRAGG